MRGIVATLDAVVALLIAVFVIGATMQLLSKPPARPDDYLYKYSMDVLTVATKDGSFARGFDEDWTGLAGLADSMSSNVCYNLTVTNATGHQAYNRERDCGPHENAVIGRRVVSDRTRVYTAELEAWYK